ncbi:MAG: glutaredoxin family protein [Cyanobacteriota bacterium]|nr:glutaredoxin family protein [Cyanobacteriota bacterium]
MRLMLFTRRGCCLCEGLEQKLHSLEPPPSVETRDVDADPALAARYGLDVPVLAIASAETTADSWRELPRVPPRLKGEGLRIWLQKQGFTPPSA